jgi:hypothetical protein
MVKWAMFIVNLMLFLFAIPEGVIFWLVVLASGTVMVRFGNIVAPPIKR